MEKEIRGYYRGRRPWIVTICVAILEKGLRFFMEYTQFHHKERL